MCVYIYTRIFNKIRSAFIFTQETKHPLTNGNFQLLTTNSKNKFEVYYPFTICLNHPVSLLPHKETGYDSD